MALFTGTAGDDHLVGTNNNDTFLIGAGHDFADGRDGNDTFVLGALFDPLDQIIGGAGTDTLNLNGDYTLVFQAATMSGVETMLLAAGHDYSFQMNDGNVFGGAFLRVDASALATGESLVFDGSAETDGTFVVIAGAGDDRVKGSAGDDFLSFTFDGKDSAFGGDGTDDIFFGDSLTRNDRIDGGDGSDFIVLEGDYSAGLTPAAGTLKNVELVELQQFGTYKLKFDDGNVAAGEKLLVIAEPNQFNGMVLDLSAETDGIVELRGAIGVDTLIAGAGADKLIGNGNADRLTGGGGADTFVYTAASDSTSNTFDKVIGFDAQEDLIDAFFTVAAVDATVASGTLSKASFDADLAVALPANALGKHHAVLFTPDAGDLAGHVFLIIDANNVKGYQAAAPADLVIELVNGVHLNQLDTLDFI